MRLIQVMSEDGEYNIGLFHTERTDNEQVDTDIKDAFDAAQLEAENNDEVSPSEIAELVLEAKGITRVYVDEVYVKD